MPAANGNNCADCPPIPLCTIYFISMIAQRPLQHSPAIGDLSRQKKYRKPGTLPEKHLSSERRYCSRRSRTLPDILPCTPAINFPVFGLKKLTATLLFRAETHKNGPHHYVAEATMPPSAWTGTCNFFSPSTLTTTVLAFLVKVGALAW